MKSILLGLIDNLVIKRPRVRRFLTTLLERDQDIMVEIAGIELQINSLKEHGYLRASRLCKSSSLLRDELAVMINLAALVARADTFVDVGANVGVYTRMVARLRSVMPELKIYAFEANPDTFIRLTRSLPAGVHATNVAISAADGFLEFVPGVVSHVYTTVHHATQYNLKGAAERIPCRRLDQIGLEGKRLVIKIDVEGQEFDVLEGASGLFEDGRVKAVYLDGYEKKQAVEALLESHGFQFLDGRTMNSTTGTVYSLLAVHREHEA